MDRTEQRIMRHFRESTEGAMPPISGGEICELHRLRTRPRRKVAPMTAKEFLIVSQAKKQYFHRPREYAIRANPLRA